MRRANHLKFSLVIPCYNEEKNIPILIKKYKNFLNDKKNEIVLINNGSTDNSSKVFKKLNKYRNIRVANVKKNIGFGYGLKKGLYKARGQSILYSHADTEIDPKDVLRSIKILNNKKIKFKNEYFIKGNRTNKRKNYWSWNDIFFSWSLTIISTLIFRQFLFDIHGQPVLFPRKMLKEVKYLPNDFSIDLAFYVHAKKNNYQIIRFPLNFNKKKRYFGVGSNNTIYKKIKTSLVQLYQCFKIVIN